MGLWMVLAILGQLLNAVVALIDKYIVTSQTVVLRPFEYTFWVSILSAGSIIVFFFSWVNIPIEGLAVPSFQNIQSPNLFVFSLAILAGYSFFTALLSFFTALKGSDASDTVPVVGGLSAFFTLILSYFFLGTKLPQEFFLGFALLIVGTILISRFRFTWNVALSAIHAGLMYGLHYITFKALIMETNFDNAFFWSRFGIVLVALSMLLIPDYWGKIVTRTREVKKRDSFFVLGNKVLAGLASIILLKAIEFGDVALVQALGGLQYLFLLIISIVLGSKLHADFGENLTVRDMIHKIISIPLIALGFFLLFI
jgi:uncharacterized membrane protein